MPVSATGQPRGEGAAVNAEAGDGRLSASVTVPPYERVMLSKLRLQDPYEDAALAYSMSWRLHEPDAAEVHSRAIEEHATVAAKLEEAVTSWAELPTPRKRAGAVALVEPSDVRNVVRKSMSGSYIDLDFPPLASSISASSNAGGDKGRDGAAEAEGAAEGAAEGTRPEVEGQQPDAAADPRLMYTWRRPSEFLAGKAPRVFLDGMVPNDVQQEPGNCWFMCSVAALAEFLLLSVRSSSTRGATTPGQAG